MAVRVASDGFGIGHFGVTGGVVEFGAESLRMTWTQDEMRGRLLNVAGNVVQNELQNEPPECCIKVVVECVR